MKRAIGAFLAAISFSVVSDAMAQAPQVGVPQPATAPGEVIMLVEIPAGSFTKYEIDASTGYLVVDRFLSTPVAYPGNYGSITATAAGDGDPLDIIVYTRQAIVPGALIRVRPIGVLKMLDGGEVDDKIIAVPASQVDPTYDGVADVKDLPAMERERLTAFFGTYKQLPKKSKVVELRGIEGAASAKAVIRAAMDAYAAAPPR